MYNVVTNVYNVSDDRPVGEPDIEVEGTARPQLFSGDLPTGE